MNNEGATPSNPTNNFERTQNVKIKFKQQWYWFFQFIDSAFYRIEAYQRY